MTWYQPAHAKAYTGLRRYGSGNWVQAYSVYPNNAEAEEGEEQSNFVTVPKGAVVMLMGASTLAAGAIALGAAALTL